MREHFKSKRNVIKPKVKNGKVLLDRENPLHRYLYEGGNKEYKQGRQSDV